MKKSRMAGINMLSYFSSGKTSRQVTSFVRTDQRNIWISGCFLILSQYRYVRYQMSKSGAILFVMLKCLISNMMKKLNWRSDILMIRILNLEYRIVVMVSRLEEIK